MVYQIPQTVKQPPKPPPPPKKPKLSRRRRRAKKRRRLWRRTKKGLKTAANIAWVGAQLASKAGFI